MSEIKFKATRRASGSCGDYRQIAKNGDTKFDWASSSDDVIILYTKDGASVKIDCDLKTGQFRMFFDADHFKQYPL